MTALGDVVRSAEDLRPDDGARACDIAAEVISDRAEGEAYVASVCFKHGPPRRTGVELEYTVHYRHDPRRPLRPEDLAAALGPHTPRTLRPQSPHDSLPSGSVLSLEPGGQVEISTLPQTSLSELATVTDGDLLYVTELLASRGLVLGHGGTDAFRSPTRLLDTPRYSAMERRFNAMGPDGAVMMCATAGLQICVDVGERDDFPARWAALHALGPVLVALFAASPKLAGADTGLASARWLSVMRTEPARTAPGGSTTDPAAAWAARVLDTPLLVFRAEKGAWDAPTRLTFAEWIQGKGDAARLRRPTFSDLDYHLTTLFTPVRPRGYFEVRYLDAQPPEDWFLPVALLSSLLSRPAIVDRALDACEPVAEAWEAAVRQGLSDARIARAASAVVDIGCAGLADIGLGPAAVAALSEALHRRTNTQEVA